MRGGLVKRGGGQRLKKISTARGKKEAVNFGHSFHEKKVEKDRRKRRKNRKRISLEKSG